MFVYREYYLQGKEPRPATVEHAEWQAKMNEVSHLAELIIQKQGMDLLAMLCLNLRRCSLNLNIQNN